MKPKFTIKRVALATLATFGVMIAPDGIPFTNTLERPWLNNQTGVSCIPAGVYTCKRVKSPKFGNTFQVMDVPGRAEILLHKGNLASDSHGCILIGERFEPVNGVPGIAESAVGFGELMQKLEGVNEFELEIIEV